MKIVSKICGHSSTRITEQIYAKLLDETVVDAVQDLEI
jgi:integrase